MEEVTRIRGIECKLSYRCRYRYRGIEYIEGMFMYAYQNKVYSKKKKQNAQLQQEKKAECAMIRNGTHAN